MQNVILLACALALAAFPANAARDDDALAVLNQILEADGGPGVTAAIVRDGELIWAGAVGLADVEVGRALTLETPMRIGSVSKTLTASLALRLMDEGSLDINGDVRVLIPEFVTLDDAPLTVRQLASHTSGLRQYDFANYLEANNVFFHPTLTEGNAAFFEGAFVAAPGTEHHYTSIGFNMLGIAAERASELDFGTAMRVHVTAPLGLTHTMIDHPLAIIPNRTRLYTRFPDGRTLNTIWRDSSDYYPSGGMLSTASDLARHTAAVFQGDFLSAEARTLVRTEATTHDGRGVGYTFGWQIHYADDGAVAWYGHGGETNGAYAIVRYYPAEDLAVAAIMNANFAVGEPIFFDAITNDLVPVFTD